MPRFAATLRIRMTTLASQLTDRYSADSPVQLGLIRSYTFPGFFGHLWATLNKKQQQGKAILKVLNSWEVLHRQKTCAFFLGQLHSTREEKERQNPKKGEPDHCLSISETPNGYYSSITLLPSLIVRLFRNEGTPSVQILPPSRLQRSCRPRSGTSVAIDRPVS